MGVGGVVDGVRLGWDADGGLGGDGEAGEWERDAGLLMFSEGFVDGVDVGHGRDHAVTEESVFDSSADGIEDSSFAVEFNF